MKKDDLVSIVVPIYKVENVLDRCIQSIINQSYKNIEIILVDDGSPDNCPKMCDKYKTTDKRIKVIHKENGGLSSARNVGIKKSKGKYICFVDSDDYIEKDYIKKMYYTIKKTNLDFVVCNYNRVYNKKIQKCKVDKFKTDNFITPAAWNKMYKKSLFDEISFPEGLYYEDLGTFPKLYCLGSNYKIVDDYLYNYVQNDNSIMHQKNDKIFDVYKILNDNYDYIVKNNNVLIHNIEIAYIFHILIGTMYRASFRKDFTYKMYISIIKEVTTKFKCWYKNKNIKKLNIMYKIYLWMLRHFKRLLFCALKTFNKLIKTYK